VAPYLDNTEIATRLLDRFDITAVIVKADADIASSELDAAGPFIGEKLDTVTPQALQFPRDTNPDGTDNADEEIPPPVLDWVALRAFQLSTDEDPAVKSESAGRVSVTYADPKPSQNEVRMARLLVPYQLNTGGFWTLGVASSFDTSTFEATT